MTIETEPLFTMRMKVETQSLGATRGIERRVVVINECVIEGRRLNGRALPGGSDWLTIEPDGALMLDCRMVIQADDDALIGMQYRGVRHGSPEAVADKWERGEHVDSSEYYH